MTSKSRAVIGQGCSMEQMESIRDQQESLARLHFELATKQDLNSPMSEDSKDICIDNIIKQNSD